MRRPRSAAAAIAWELGNRHCWGFSAIAAYFIALAAYKLLFGHADPITLDVANSSPEISERFAFTVIVPLTCAFFYLLAVFSYGLSSDVAARESMYPARMFSLPVSTSALAFWPMLYAMMSMIALWYATVLLGLRPSGLDFPLIWPALFIAAFVGWTQALMWMPYGLGGIRIIVAVLLMTTIDTTVILAITYKVRESTMIAILAPLIPLAYLTARYALTRSRRGDVPDWRGVFRSLPALADVLPRRRQPLKSPYAAQAWFEWRQSGVTLPVWVAIVVPFELALLFLPGADPHKLVFYGLLRVLLTPPILAAFAAAGVSKANPDARDSYNLAPFLATRPLTTAAFIGAKMKMTLWSTLAAWLFVALAIPIALVLSGTWTAMTEVAAHGFQKTGMWRGIGIVVVAAGILVVTTWRLLTQTLYIGLAGRAWAMRLHMLFVFAFLFCILPILEWIQGSYDAVNFLWDNLDWILALLVVIKMTAAAWITFRLDASRLLSARALVTGAALWCATVLMLYALMIAILSTPLIPHHLFALIAILAVPLARVSASPLAFAWNRHR